MNFMDCTDCQYVLGMPGILEYQQNRPPLLMIDFVGVNPGSSAIGYKDFGTDEWFFKVHFPLDPCVPGVFQTEAMTQLASLMILTIDGNAGKVVYLSRMNNVRYLRKIPPDSRLELETKLLSYKRGVAICSGCGWVDKILACSAEFVLTLPDEIAKYTKG